MFKTITIALAGAALLAAPTVSAQQAETRTAGVAYRDLDLGTAEGRAALERRIDNAARAACGMDEAVVGTRLPTREKRECYRNAKRQLDERFAMLMESPVRGG